MSSYWSCHAVMYGEKCFAHLSFSLQDRCKGAVFQKIIKTSASFYLLKRNFILVYYSVRYTTKYQMLTAAEITQKAAEKKKKAQHR